MMICVNAHFGYAQWTERDSLWLKGVLAGSDTIRLNPETMRAIREGSLIRPDDARPELLQAPAALPIIKDFTGVGIPDSFRREVDPATVPAAVYSHQQLSESDSVPDINREAYTTKESFAPKDWKRIGKSPVSVKGGGQNLFSSDVKDGQRRGSVGASVRVDFSFEDWLRYLFWPSEREKKKNRKRAENLQYYTESP